MSSDHFNDFEFLMASLLDGVATPEQFQQLQELVKNDGNLRERYIELLELHVDLVWGAKTEPLPAATTPSATLTETDNSSPNKWPGIAIAIAACALICLTILVQTLFFRNESPVAENPSTKKSNLVEVASISRQLNCVWNHPPPEKGLLVGDRVELAEGIVEIAFDRGQTITLFGPALLELTRADSFSLKYGLLNAVLIDSPHFELTTPSAQVTSGVAECSMAVDRRSGETLVSVYDGELTVSSMKSTSAQKVRENQQASVNSTGKLSVQELQNEYGRFARALPDLSTKLIERSGRHYPPYAWNGLNGSWEDAMEWFGNQIPTAESSVRVSRGIMLDINSHATAGEVFVGTADITVNQNASLAISGLSGSLDVGFRPHPSSLTLKNSVAKIQNRLVLRDHSDLVIENGQVDVGTDLFLLDGTSVIILQGGQAVLDVGNFYGMADSDILKITGTQQGIPLIVVRGIVQLGGELQMDMSAVSGSPTTILLINNMGNNAVQGTFKNVHEGQLFQFAGNTYRFTYVHAATGGNANDVALVKQ